MKPYGIISDSHNHNWSAFSAVLPSGINSRLQMTLDETKRCAAEVKKAGGNVMIHAGDVFHVRGEIAPSVLNPTLDCYADIVKDGVSIYIIPGNHDLEGREASRISSAVTALERVGCKVVHSWEGGLNKHDDIVFVPWIPNIAELKKCIEHVAPTDRTGCDLILHAPIDGVIPGLPDHGLTDTYLAGLGYRRVFAGHYHHHKDFSNGVYSVGSLTAQNWSDVSAKSGFLIVSDEGVKWFKSHAPQFVEITGATDPAEAPLLADGNYVRVHLKTAKNSEIEAVRSFLMDNGALGVVVVAQREEHAPARGSSAVKPSMSLEQSVNDYIKAGSFGGQAELAALCAEILTEARSV